MGRNLHDIKGGLSCTICQAREAGNPYCAGAVCVLAQYEGGGQWRVKFVRDELGTWTVVRPQHFTDGPYQSEPVAFDMVPGGRSAIVTASP